METGMESNTNKPTTTDEYIAQFSEDMQQILQKVRKVIKESTPGAVERISYGMPGFYLNGMLVWFAGHKTYIGFYPTGEGIEAFKCELISYKFSKGAVQFPLDRPIPYDLIRKMVRYRVERNTRKQGKRY
jgi:uncharacterized protein YdhG (YjbR/CyaY superfamily)